MSSMKYDPSIHHRRSIRLLGYDYAQAGGYYVTIVTQGHECMFGEIRGGQMVCNDAGRMVVKWWDELPHKFPSITVNEFVVMPNHVHGIIFLHEIVGATLVVARNFVVDDANRAGTRPAPTINDIMPDNVDRASTRPAPTINDIMPDDSNRAGTRPAPTIGNIIGAFKSITTHEYIRGVRRLEWPPFPGKLWQRNYYEHIIRNQIDYERIADYIFSNPANWENDEENKP